MACKTKAFRRRNSLLRLSVTVGRCSRELKSDDVIENWHRFMSASTQLAQAKASFSPTLCAAGSRHVDRTRWRAKERHAEPRRRHRRVDKLRAGKLAEYLKRLHKTGEPVLLRGQRGNPKSSSRTRRLTEKLLEAAAKTERRGGDGGGDSRGVWRT